MFSFGWNSRPETEPRTDPALFGGRRWSARHSGGSGPACGDASPNPFEVSQREVAVILVARDPNPIDGVADRPVVLRLG